MSNASDFDAWYTEATSDEPPTRTITYFGRDWDIPADPPALAMLQLGRLRQLVITGDEDTTVPDDIAHLSDPVDALRALVGDEPVDGWLKAGMARRQASATVWRLHALYSDILDEDEADEDEEGKAPGPETAKQPSPSTGSSDTGNSSKRTGKRSTDETSPASS